MPRKTRIAPRPPGMTPGASMRPRPDAAENCGSARRRTPRRRRFNEAAARCRGKRPPRPCPSHRAGTRFNEAAARCRGKRGLTTGGDDAGTGFNEAAARCRGKRAGRAGGFVPDLASMRPRPDAAENVPVRRNHAVPLVRASMRPRPDAAENRGDDGDVVACPDASMRPRPDAAENAHQPSDCLSRWRGFNEAAARCRGKRRRRNRNGQRGNGGFNEAAARCRGKLFVSYSLFLRFCLCFNEAAARCRGKHTQHDGQGAVCLCFNEAAARCRGKRPFRRAS